MKRHVHTDHCSCPKPHDGFNPGPPSRSSKARRAIHAPPERNVPGRDEPMRFLSGAGSYQVKGPIQYGPKTAPDGGRNKFLSAPGLTMTWLTGSR